MSKILVQSLSILSIHAIKVYPNFMENIFGELYSVDSNLGILFLIFCEECSTDDSIDVT